MTQESLTSKSVFRALQAVILVIGASSILSVHAQSFQPTCPIEAAYASLEGRGLYVQGGVFNSGQEHNEAFMIDLSESWDINKPKYKKLPNGFNHSYTPSGITSDGKLWTVLASEVGVRYSADSNSWKEIFRFDTYGLFGLTGATDHETNMMYIPFGFANADRTKGMLRVDLKTGDTTSDRKSYPMNKQDQYAAAWNPLRKSVIYVGDNNVLEYTWEQGWKPFFKEGLDVLPYWDGCLVSVSGGKKMALFGGASADGNPIGDIYVLDLTKKGKERWTKASVDSTQKSQIARLRASCGSTGDQVIISGGSAIPRGRGFQCSKQRTLVFNVETMKWMDRYVAPKK
ncbi:MAG: hypothetical protein J3Q66DRAFT_375604 [Benniella sp.]|nr:MAG: hypothetical protein J3Q66DRAFT_375604 [Benniella sp.]